RVVDRRRLGGSRCPALLLDGSQQRERVLLGDQRDQQHDHDAGHADTASSLHPAAAAILEIGRTTLSAPPHPIPLVDVAPSDMTRRYLGSALIVAKSCQARVWIQCQRSTPEPSDWLSRSTAKLASPAIAA